LFALALAALPTLTAQDGRFRPPPVYVAGGKADQTEGARVLGEFRQAGIAGQHWLAFTLRVMPRRGPERVIDGQMFGTHGPQGPVTRLQIGTERWLIQAGATPAAWTVQDGTSRAVTAAETLQVIAGTDLTLFDLQMPFLHWADFVYEGLAKVRGRPAHRFVLYPPADLAAARPELSGVRVFLDTQFQALVQVEQLGADGKPARSVTLIDLKKVDGQWLVKSIDLRNHVTRDKTRLTITTAALDLALPAEAFAPAQLAQPPPVVPADKIETL
jgi:hypothetical protein